MRSIRSRHRGSSSRNDGSFWLNFSDLMSSLLLIIILIMFYIIYQYFDMYESPGSSTIWTRPTPIWRSSSPSSPPRRSRCSPSRFA